MGTTYILTVFSRYIHRNMTNYIPLERHRRVGLYDIKIIFIFSLLKKKNEDEKNELFFYNTYILDFYTGESRIFSDYKYVKIVYKFKVFLEIQGLKVIYVNKPNFRIFSSENGG